MRFKITWSTGKEEVYEQSDCETVEQAINTRFGSAWAEAEASGVTMELVNADYEPKADTETEEKPAE